MADEKDTLTATDLKGGPNAGKGTGDETAGKPRQKTVAELEAIIERLKIENWDLKKAHEKDMAINRDIIKDKKEPGIAAYDHEGREMKKKESRNPWGLSEMVLPPYIKGRIAVYAIVKNKEVNPATNLPAHDVPVMMPGRYGS